KQTHNLRDSGRTKEAIQLYAKLFQIYDKNKNYWHAGGALQGIGVSHKIDNNTKEALRNLKKAAQYFKKHKLNDGIGNALRDTGITYEYVNKLSLAEKCLRESAGLLKNSQDKAAYAITLAKIGLVKTRKKEFKEAEKILKEAIQILAKTGHWFFHATAIGHLADYYLEIKKYGSALVTLSSALKIYNQKKQQKIHRRRYAQLWGMQAFALVNLGKFKEAGRVLSQSLSIIFNELSPSAAAVVLKDIRADRTIRLLMEL
ncbi:tetratricopeptide repeat protein, partial [Candidatus Berkelbacteria bacterium]|nr:tetratricopeptide repeat protein [Candidatus Berkelbacteria bacterium]